MYPPPHHQCNDRAKLISVINHFPLGMMVSAIDGKPLITHIPFIYNTTSEKLVGHIDRSNPQIEGLKNGAEITVVFKGPDTYISPSVYSTAQLPTWNYIIVHLIGTINLINDANEVKQSMVAMTEYLERPLQKFELKKDDPRMDRLINYIQTFEIEITQLEGKFKLSQDKNPQDFENAKQELIKKSENNVSGFINGIYDNL